ncbi:hypothetical protein C8A01DRAFT_39701, partial [Parachaetomium inaequale]
MMPMRSLTADSLPTLRDDLSRMESNKSTPVLVLPHRFDRQWSNATMTALSPPPGSKSTQPRRQKSHLRLRSDSGLALHTNQPAFRQYTHYNSDGTVPTRPGPARALSFDDNSSVEELSLGHRFDAELRGLVSNGRVLPDFFEPAVIKLAFSNPATVQRLRAFAETRHGGSDIDFLLKVEEYSRALGDIIASMSYISANFTGTTAISPLELSLDAASALKANIKYCARAALPALGKVYQEAKSTAEERLSQNLYPEFVKYQLSQCLTASLSTTRPLAGEMKTPYPGLGDAFCLTDPLQPDNPVVFASDGLLSMSGYQRGELVGKNCRLLQGIATDPEAARRLSMAAAAGREVTELLLNYRPDGTPYWNFLFVCPLMENGSVRYFFGAQVNVSEHMRADFKDILGVLNFGRSPPEGLVTQAPSPPASPDWPARQSSDNLELDQTDDQNGDKRTSRRRRFLRHFQRRSTPSRASSRSRPSTASERAIDDSPPPVPSPRCYPPPITSPRLDHHPLPCPSHHQQLDEHSTPYSRFLVLRYNNTQPPSRTSSSHPRRPPQSENKRLLTRDNNNNNTTTPSGAGAANRLPIAFCSPHALALLGLLHPHELDPSSPLLDRDVFSVLSSRLGSPTVNRVFRANVTSKLARGECVSVDLMAPVAAAAEGVPAGGGGWGGGSSSSSRPPGVRMVRTVGPGSGAGTAGALNGEVGGGEARPRLSGTLDRGAELFSQVLFAGSIRGGGGSGALRRV